MQGKVGKTKKAEAPNGWFGLPFKNIIHFKITYYFNKYFRSVGK